MYGFPCEMDFPPLVFESHPRLGRDSETRGEKNPSHMEKNIQNAYHPTALWGLISLLSDTIGQHFGALDHF